MDKNSKFDEQRIASELDKLVQSGSVPLKYLSILLHFYKQVHDALAQAGRPLDSFYEQFALYLTLLQKQFQSPFAFEPYHRKIRQPIDYYRFSLNFIRPLINLPRSRVFGLDIATKIEELLQRGENAVLLANHQTETDPLSISILLEQTHPTLAEKIIYVAGERVVTDPLAVPFSMGCDLLCIYSKRYIDHPIELKAKKQLHNKKTMERMRQLLSEGGKVIYVAPSGGRDRRNSQGIVEVAPFDPHSIEMFDLMARKSNTPTHFFPLTLATYELMPPPETIQVELGEKRPARFTPIHISFSPEFDMNTFDEADKSAFFPIPTQNAGERGKARSKLCCSNDESIAEGAMDEEENRSGKAAADRSSVGIGKEADKSLKRKNRAEAIWNIVNHEHERLINL
ncbi:MAG: Glycerol-3-phosphate acyltransferase [Parachlamydiales bacterium]|nr:Glycerol-3-phosphate acyltransferase [Parachlamydiales bacterium]